MASERIGPYEVVRPIARGGQATVYEVRAADDPRRLALKRAEAALGVEERLRFEREGELLARLRLPGLVAVHGAGRDDAGRPFLVLELLDGPTLEALGPLPAERAAAIVRDVADTVAALHAAGVVHRDLTPRNVSLVRRDDGVERPVLLDLGIARADDGQGLTKTGTVLGTPGFLAPEQALGEPTSPATDVHGLGALLFALLTGRPPFEPGEGSTLEALAAFARRAPPDPRQHAPATPPSLAALCARAMARDPGARPSAVELRDALARVRGPEPARSPVGLAVVGVVVLLAALAIAPRAAVTPPPTPTTTVAPAPPALPAPVAAVPSAAVDPAAPLEAGGLDDDAAAFLDVLPSLRDEEAPAPRDKPVCGLEWSAAATDLKASSPVWVAFVGAELFVGARLSCEVRRFALVERTLVPLRGWRLPSPAGAGFAVGPRGRLLVATVDGVFGLGVPPAGPVASLAPVGSAQLVWRPWRAAEPAAPDALAVARDGRLAVGTRRTVWVQGPAGQPDRALPGTGNARALAFAGPTEDQLAVAHLVRRTPTAPWTGRLLRCDVTPRKPVEGTPLLELGQVQALVVDGDRLFSGAVTEALRPATEGRLKGVGWGEVLELPLAGGASRLLGPPAGPQTAHGLAVRALTLLPDGRLVSLSRDAAGLRLWGPDRAAGGSLPVFCGESLSASSDGRWLAVGHVGRVPLAVSVWATPER